MLACMRVQATSKVSEFFSIHIPAEENGGQILSSFARRCRCRLHLLRLFFFFSSVWCSCCSLNLSTLPAAAASTCPRSICWRTVVCHFPKNLERRRRRRRRRRIIAKANQVINLVANSWPIKSLAISFQSSSTSASSFVSLDLIWIYLYLFYFILFLAFKLDRQLVVFFLLPRIFFFWAAVFSERSIHPTWTWASISGFCFCWLQLCLLSPSPYLLFRHTYLLRCVDLSLTPPAAIGADWIDIDIINRRALAEYRFYL